MALLPAGSVATAGRNGVLVRSLPLGEALRYTGWREGFLAFDDGDYNAVPPHVLDRILYTVPGMMADDFDEANIARAASFMSVVMDPDFDADCPF